jgi:biotin transport system substrate-specific component
MLKMLSKTQQETESGLIQVLQVVCASLALALVSQIAIPLPFTPVPLTLQTLAIYGIALGLGPKKGVAAVLLYLVQGTMGLPVFAGGLAKPLWMISPHAGYLFGFVAATWVLGKLAERRPSASILETFFILSLGDALILTLGATFLALFVGPSQAFFLGIAPFVLGSLLKISCATAITKFINKMRG